MPPLTVNCGGACVSVAKFHWRRRRRRLRQRRRRLPPPLRKSTRLDSLRPALAQKFVTWAFPSPTFGLLDCHPLVVVCVCRPLLPLPFFRASSSASSAFFIFGPEVWGFSVSARIYFQARYNLATIFEFHTSLRRHCTISLFYFRTFCGDSEPALDTFQHFPNPPPPLFVPPGHWHFHMHFHCQLVGLFSGLSHVFSVFACVFRLPHLKINTRMVAAFPIFRFSSTRIRWKCWAAKDSPSSTSQCLLFVYVYCETETDSLLCHFFDSTSTQKLCALTPPQLLLFWVIICYFWKAAGRRTRI